MPPLISPPMRASGRRREVGIPLLLGAGAFALAFAQRPGLATADTKINLHVDPGRFLADVASMWTSTGQLGDVQSGQQTGYLFPMGPFFAARPRLRDPGLDRAAPVARSLLALAAWGWCGCSTRCSDARAASRTSSRGAVIAPQPVRRHLRQPHHGHAARVRGAAVAAARRAPRAARAAPMALAGGVRAAGHGLRRRDQRRRDGVDAARPGAAAVLRDRVHADRGGSRRAALCGARC